MVEDIHRNHWNTVEMKWPRRPSAERTSIIKFSIKGIKVFRIGMINYCAPNEWRCRERLAVSYECVRSNDHWRILPCLYLPWGLLIVRSKRKGPKLLSHGPLVVVIHQRCLSDHNSVLKWRSSPFMTVTGAPFPTLSYFQCVPFLPFHSPTHLSCNWLLVFQCCWTLKGFSSRLLLISFPYHCYCYCYCHCNSPSLAIYCGKDF